MFSGIQSKIMLAMGVVIALLGIAGYIYWSWSQNKIDVLERNNAKLQTTVNIQKETIKSLQDAQIKQANEIIRLQLNQNSAETNYRNDVNNITQFDIPAAARQNIKATEDRMNFDTQKLMQEIQAITMPPPAVPANGGKK